MNFCAQFSSLIAILCVRQSVQDPGSPQPFPSSANVHCNAVTIFGLKTSDCQGLGLDTIPSSIVADVKVLRLADNRLTQLGPGQFRPFGTLQEIYLSRNRIATIAAGAFDGLPNLQKLDVESNRLTALRADFLRDVGSVRALNFRANPIRRIERDAFRRLLRLEQLSLEDCRLVELDPRLFEGLTRLTEINLAGNELTTLSSTMERYLPVGLTIFRFYRNPWLCDCSLRWLRLWINSKSLTVSSTTLNWDFARNTPTCSGPRLLRGVSWKHLDAEQFACPSQIIVNSSTSIEVQPGGNISIECVVVGDPEPMVTWYKETTPVNENWIEEFHEEPEDSDVTKIRSYVTLRDVNAFHAGDYRCVAENSAGRSEVTFKVWLQPALHHESLSPHTPLLGDQLDSAGHGRLSTRQELILGCTFAVVLLALVGIVVCSLIVYRRRRRFRRHEYHVRDFDDKLGQQTASGVQRSSMRSARRGRRRQRFFPCLGSTRQGEDDRSAGRESTAGGGGDQHSEDDVDRYVSSTLRSLLEAKQLGDSLPPAAGDEVSKFYRFVVVSADDDLAADEAMDKAKAKEAAAETAAGKEEDANMMEVARRASDVRQKSTDFTQREPEVQLGTAAVACDGNVVEHEVKSQQQQISTTSEAAPDLLNGGDGRLSFQRGSLARSPFKRSKAGVKAVSFADCQSPSTSSDSGTAGGGGLLAGCCSRAEENPYTKPSALKQPSRSSAEQPNYGCSDVDAFHLAAMETFGERNSNERSTQNCAAGGKVDMRRSNSASAAASKVSAAPSSSSSSHQPNCHGYSTIPRNNHVKTSKFGESSSTAAVDGPPASDVDQKSEKPLRYVHPDQTSSCGCSCSITDASSTAAAITSPSASAGAATGLVSMALPDTIVGVTDGLFPQPAHRKVFRTCDWDLDEPKPPTAGGHSSGAKRRAQQSPSIHPSHKDTSGTAV